MGAFTEKAPQMLPLVAQQMRQKRGNQG